MSFPSRWMLFVDGENLTIRAQELAKKQKIKLVIGDYWKKDCFFWIPSIYPQNIFTPIGSYILSSPYALPDSHVRSYYYMAIKGDDSLINEIRSSLKKIRFDPRVFKKYKGKSKEVDISIATEVLGHAYRNNYDLAVLIAGDRDYVPLVDELKRLGKIVWVYFFTGELSGLSEDLRIMADYFGSLNEFVFGHWIQYINRKVNK